MREQIRQTIQQNPVQLTASQRLTPEQLALDANERRGLVRAREIRARQGLAGFTEYLIKECNVSPKYAGQTTVMAWTLFEENDGNPAAQFYDAAWLSTCTYQALCAARRALRHLATWLLATSKHETDLEWAREQMRLLAAAPTKTYARTKARPSGSVKLEARSPLPHEQMNTLLAAIDERGRHYLMTRRQPWYRDVMRLAYLSATPIVRVAQMRREDITSAVEAGKTKGRIPIWSTIPAGQKARVRRIRAIPVALVWQEAKNIAGWSWPWQVIADLVSPCADPVRSLRRATSLLVGYQAEISGIVAQTHGLSLAERRRVKQRATWWVYQELMRLRKDWILLQAFTGQPITELKRYPYLRDAEHDWGEGEGEGVGEGLLAAPDDAEADLSERRSGDDEAAEAAAPIVDDHLEPAVFDASDIC